MSIRNKIQKVSHRQASRDRTGGLSFEIKADKQGSFLNVKDNGRSYRIPAVRNSVSADKKLASSYIGVATDSSGVAVPTKNIQCKIFTGTSASAGNDTEITQGIPSGKKRICLVNIAIAGDTVAGSAPNNSFITGGGNFQDEATSTREFQSAYDDTKVYIHIDSGASGVASNQYVCTVWYTDSDIY